jgi:hypothetical protein
MSLSIYKTFLLQKQIHIAHLHTCNSHNESSSHLSLNSQKSRDICDFTKIKPQQ